MTDWTYIRWRAARAVPLFLGVFLPLFIGGVWLADQVPIRYKTTAVIMLEQAPGETQTARPRPGEAAPERLRVIAQKVTAHDRLSAMKITLGAPDAQVSTQVAAGREKATLLTVETSSKSAQTSYDLAALLLAAVRDDYASSLRARSENADAQALALVETLSESTAELSERLNLSRGVVALFPEGASATLQAQLRHLDKQEQAFNAQRNGPISSPERTRLEAELNRALTVYSREHPKVILLLGKIDALPGGSASQAASIDINALQAERVQLAARLDRITTAKADLTTLRTDHAQALRDLAQARRDLDRRTRHAQNQFDQNMQLLSIVTPPTLPQVAALPSPALARVLAIFAAFALAAAVAILSQRFDRVIHRAADLERHLGITPFATLPRHDPLTP